LLFLGEETDVRQQLPLGFDFGSGRFRLVDIAGTLMAHSATCPHWLGPLHGAPDTDGVITCPWHGYRFDVASGCSADGRGLRLAPAPAIRIERGRVVACA
jgi:nitrite reductase/ring-hydroxylating ferredoxin subunit